VRTMGKLVGVSAALVLAFIVSFVFAVLRLPVGTVVAPFGHYFLIGVLIPMCLVLASMTFFVLNAVFSESARKVERSDLVPLLDSEEPGRSKGVPLAYEI